MTKKNPAPSSDTNEDVCGYSAAHAMQGIPSTTTRECGPAGTVKMCDQCASFYDKLSSR